MDEYRESNSNRKRMLIPLLTLMLCVMALVSCAYAYNHSSLLIGDNEVETQYYVIDYTDDAGVSIDAPITVDDDGLILYTDIVNVQGGADTITVRTDGTQTFTMSFYVTVVSNDDTKTFNLTVTSNVAEVDVIKDLVTIETVTINDVEKDTPTEVTVTFSVKAVSDLSTIVTTEINSYQDLDDVADEIEGHKITFTVNATPVAA